MSIVSDKSLLYAPEAYAAPDPAALVRQYPFALLITTSPTGVHATSTPLFFEQGSTDTLIGHLAARNEQADHLHAGQPALAVFAGPHAYISAAWYAARPTVPTWNYVVAHVRGRIQPVDDREQTLAVLRRTAAAMENCSANPWTLEQAPAGRVDSLLPLIRAFRIAIDRIDGVTKLSQVQPASDQIRVVRALLERGDGNSVEIARLMMQLQAAATDSPSG